MNQFLRRTLLCCLAPFLALSAQAQGAISAAVPEDSRLDDGLANAKKDVAVFVRMEDQLFPRGGDYERFCSERSGNAKRLELREEVIATLKAKSHASFENVQAALEGLVETEEVTSVRRYWIVNGFACRASAKGCAALADLPGVAFVYRQRYAPQEGGDSSEEFEEDAELTALYRKLMEHPQDDSSEPFESAGLEVPWNLQAVGAEEAWNEHGVTGKGVVIAVLDDGMMTVPALLPGLWRNTEEKLNGKDDDGNGLVDDVFGYDFAKDTPYSVTPKGHRHGTLCASVMAARPTPGDAKGEGSELAEKPMAAGVAPRAKIMPLVGNGRLRAYEYALEKGADIISMSYTLEPAKMGQYRGLFRAAHEHLSAAGIVSLGGAGNYAKSRPEGLQIGSTKDVPCVIAAAGVGPDLTVTSFSSRGPVSWEGIRFYDGAEAASVKPNVTTCNSGFPMWTLPEIWTAAKADRVKNVVREDSEGYALVIGPRGNSFAGPHVAGVAALMLEADPELPVWRLQEILESTCRDMGEPGRDTAYGAGMVQASQAVEAVLRED